MSTSPLVRKIVRLTLTTVAAGAGAAFLFLGAPADAAMMLKGSRGI